MPEILQLGLLSGFLLTLLVFGFAPPFLLRLILRLYPHDSVRKTELMAELRARPWRQRPMWIAEQLESGLSEGLPLRVREARNRRRDRQAAKIADSISSKDTFANAVHRAAVGDSVTVIEIKKIPDPNNPGQMIEIQQEITRTGVGIELRHTGGRRKPWPRFK